MPLPSLASTKPQCFQVGVATKVLILPLFLLACSPAQPVQEQVRKGWDYSEGPHRNSFRYHFGDEAGTYFAGTCNAGPGYALMNGDYSDTDRFRLIVDGRQWTLPAFRGVHGRSLIIGDAPQVTAAIAAARREIRFEIGRWSRALEPAPMIRKFAARCAAAVRQVADVRAARLQGRPGPARGMT
jgi:hypothetical protein